MDNDGSVHGKYGAQRPLDITEKMDLTKRTRRSDVGNSVKVNARNISEGEERFPEKSLTEKE